MTNTCRCRRHGGPDRRPGSKDRARLRRRLAERLGNGVICPCTWCGVLVAADRSLAGYLNVPVVRRRIPVTTMELDRLEAGGPYSLWNLVPACGPCNRARSNEPLCDWLATYQQPGSLPAAVTALFATDPAPTPIGA